ncbi:MAG: AAA family ATPase [Polaromonas sp.]|jgi:predicted ATPase|nr:AAA family ATPase [Polaromonas sp.]
MTILIKNLALAGYRSFGKAPQYFDKFAKINLLIGRNNAGKSNVIRFLDEIYPKVEKRKNDEYDPLSRNLNAPSTGLIGLAEELIETSPGNFSINDNFHLLSKFTNEYERSIFKKTLSKILIQRKNIAKTKLPWSLYTIPYTKKILQDGWDETLEAFTDQELHNIWSKVFNMSGGSRDLWINQLIPSFSSDIQPVKVVVIPAIRQIGEKGSKSEEFDGNGIIERLARLQNPSIENLKDKKKFLNIRDFLRSVIDNYDAEIEVPHDRDTISVYMDGKTLPLESLGTGIHEVLILATAATVLSDYVICIEEPELHLNPILQKKFIRYLKDYTSNQYFISTHSPALMDTPDIEIYHIKLENGASIVDRVTTDTQRSHVCEDLGYHPSDLLQANSIIWVEGPSDRVYLNYWLSSIAPNFIEGVHYSIMFYAGKLASHLTYLEDNHEVDDFISLRKLNRRGVMILDSDKESKTARYNKTKIRLKDEFDKGPGHAWITEGREIENYVPIEQIKEAIAKIAPSATLLSKFGKYDNYLKIRNKVGNEIQASKVDVARYVVKNFQPNFDIYDLKKRINKLVQFIKDANPKLDKS